MLVGVFGRGKGTHLVQRCHVGRYRYAYREFVKISREMPEPECVSVTTIYVVLYY